MVEAAAGIGLVAEIGHVEALAEAVSQRRAVERRAKVGAAQTVRALEDILRAANACPRHRDREKRRARAEARLHPRRSEGHTSELQSLMRNSYDVFGLNKQIHIYYEHF